MLGWFFRQFTRFFLLPGIAILAWASPSFAQENQILALPALINPFSNSLSLSTLSLLSHWNIDDVSYLFPFPLITEPNFLIAAQNSILPKALYRKLPGPERGGDLNEDKLYPLLHVVGMRIDPCTHFTDEIPCDPEVRLVWQIVHAPILHPVSSQYDNVQVPQDPHYFTTENSGMHSFYRQTPAQMKALLAELWSLKQAGLQQDPPIDTDFLPLEVHPAFTRVEYRNAFLAKIKKIILNYCRADNLIQMTVAELNPAGSESWWLFQGITKGAHGWHNMLIPRANAWSESLFNSARGYDRSGVFPIEMAASTDVPELNDTPTGAKMENILGTISGYNSYSRTGFQSTLKLVQAFQNPAMKDMNPAHLDCVQCHVAEGAHFWMNEKMPGYDSGMIADTLFANPNPTWYNLKNTSVANRSSKINRAFGYWQQYPAVNQRVINESAWVADELNRPASR
jgi:hypothetical protein